MGAVGWQWAVGAARRPCPRAGSKAIAGRQAGWAIAQQGSQKTWKEVEGSGV